MTAARPGSEPIPHPRRRSFAACTPYYGPRPPRPATTRTRNTFRLRPPNPRNPADNAIALAGGIAAVTVGAKHEVSPATAPTGRVATAAQALDYVSLRTARRGSHVLRDTSASVGSKRFQVWATLSLPPCYSGFFVSHPLLTG